MLITRLLEKEVELLQYFLLRLLHAVLNNCMGIRRKGKGGKVGRKGILLGHRKLIFMYLVQRTLNYLYEMKGT